MRGGHNRIDLTGRQFGRLVVVGYVGTNSDGRACWNCKCECGCVVDVSGKDLRSGHSASCGCAARGYKHGQHKNRFYYVYSGMLKRCYNVKHCAYPRYGGRGITVCDEWKNNIEHFIKWCDSINPPIGYTLDRYPNNDGPYSPENCRFASRKEQQANMRSNVLVEFNGEKMIYKTFVERFGVVSYATASRRSNNGWNRIEAARTL